ncbi:excreted virulence factor EspC (type VII ESX diderm) [Rhodococcus sp. SMB37]|uniref:type VII secretion target n=1 Tax=Rhodococcus sp. SMB37 TaxID=2512213 RepID=UPI00104B0338|nr:type VII secretion target [Rhodococcus sp. SMB37]TCN57217.1 excreted virulence factor EspC (type VII ESX diderm) [Rhodococcus sp. SMB37]
MPHPETDTGTLHADTEVIAGFGRVAADLAEQIDQAALQTRTSDPAGLTSLLGPVGAGFVAAFTAAHDGHSRELDRIREVLSGMGTTATLTAAAYERTERETITSLRGIAEELEIREAAL